MCFMPEIRSSTVTGPLANLLKSSSSTFCEPAGISSEVTSTALVTDAGTALLFGGATMTFRIRQKEIRAKEVNLERDIESVGGVCTSVLTVLLLCPSMGLIDSSFFDEKF